MLKSLVSLLISAFIIIHHGLRENDENEQTKNDGSQRTALDDFVFSKESLKQFSWYHVKEYDFRRVNVITNVSYNAYVLNLTSGMWLTGNL